MLHQYIEQKLLKKNRGVYFKKGKWVLHVLMFISIWLASAGKQAEVAGVPTMTIQPLVSSFLLLLPFSIFFYFYCLYLIPSCFKRNQYARFWLILIASLLVFPLLYIGVQKLLEPYFNILLVNRSKLSTVRYLLETYGSFLASFMGFTSMLYFMELMENIRTTKEIQNNTSQLAATELHLTKTHMNPDFMIRSLDGILLLAENKNQATPEAIINFSDVLRYRLYRSTKSTVPLQEELQQLNNLFYFQNRIPGRENDVILEIEGEQLLRFIPPLSLINIAEALFTTKTVNQGEWSLLFYILIEQQDIQIAIELVADNDVLVRHRLETIQADLHRLWDTALIFTVEKDNNNYSIRTCIPILSNSTALL